MQTTTPAGLTYLEERGLTPATIAEMQPVFLTQEPDDAQDDAYRRYMREQRRDNKGDFVKTVEGLIIPYLTLEERFRPFGRQRILTAATRLINYYEKRKEPVPKFLNVSAKKLDPLPGLHLYLLPHDAEKMGKSKDVYLLTEGEVKAAALSQTARTLDDGNNNYVSIGAGGVSMFLSAPEFNTLKIKDRRVFLFFDADSYDKKEVMQQEIKLALALLVNGARAVLSVCWNPDEGKGIDDHLVWKAAHDTEPGIALRGLLRKAVSPFRKYAHPPFDGLHAYQLDSLCAEIVKNQAVKPFQLSMIAKELADAYESTGIGIKDVRRELDRARQEKIAREREKADTGKLSEEFGIEFNPETPDTFEPNLDRLCYEHSGNLRPLCKMFVISKYVYTEDPDKDDTYFLTFKDGKHLLVSSDVQSNYKALSKLFNRNREVLFDASAKMIQQYISDFWQANEANIPRVPMYENTGWNRDGFFQLPAITAEKNNAVYAADLERRFRPTGESGEQYAFIEEILTQHRAGLLSVAGFAAPIVGLFNLERYSVVIYGGPGSGKTKGCEIAVSQYGDPDRLIFSMDSTKVGKEITFSLYRDLPIVLDEFNTASPDGKKLADVAIDTIYGFYQGKGRTRANSGITHRETKEFRGLVFLTSERSLESIFSAKTNMRVGGAYRRALEFPVLDEGELWNFEASCAKCADRKEHCEKTCQKKESKTQFFARIHNHIRQHFGHVGTDWLIHLSDKDVQERLAFAYDEALKNLISQGFGNLKGTEKLIALLWAVMAELEIFLQVKDNAILKNLKPYLTAITERQQRQIDEQITDEAERFQEALENFIAMHVTGFSGICNDKATMQQIFGEVEYSDSLTHVYLRAWAFKVFCNEFGFERDTLLPKLESKDLCRRHGGQLYFNKSIRNTKGSTYHFALPSDNTEFLRNVRQRTTQGTYQSDPGRVHADAGTGTGNGTSADTDTDTDTADTLL